MMISKKAHRTHIEGRQGIKGSGTFIQHGLMASLYGAGLATFLRNYSVLLFGFEPSKATMITTTNSY